MTRNQAAALAAAVLLAGCGGGNGDDNGDSGSPGMSDIATEKTETGFQETTPRETHEPADASDY